MSGCFPACCDPVGLTGNGETASMANIGTGLDVWDDPTTGPFNLRRMEVINDGSDLHGLGNAAFWTDGDTNRIDVPRGHVQNSDSITFNDVEITLIDHTFSDDSGGANVAGKDGEDWLMIWSFKICTDTTFNDTHFQIETHDGAVWTVVDHCHVQWECSNTPGAPACRPILLQNTNWSGNSGLRVRITAFTSSFFDFTTMQDPSIYIQRFNRVAP